MVQYWLPFVYEKNPVRSFDELTGFSRVFYNQLLNKQPLCAMTIFSKIIAGQIPSYKIAESEKFFAFLDIMPLVKGHTLVIPKIEVDKIFDLPDDYLGEMLVFAKTIARAIEQSFNCNRCGISVVGLEVPHAHIHLVPINTADDLNFGRPKLKLSQDEFIEIQNKIRSLI
jgi:histidine triad (HIT) family protein